MSNKTDIVVVGAGLSGLLAALALSDPEHGPGRHVTLIDAKPIERASKEVLSAEARSAGVKSKDGRVTALTPSAVRMMRRLGVGDIDPTAMVGMRVGEGDAETPWQFELPERTAEPLALNVENEALRAALLHRLMQSDVICRGETRVEALSLNGHAQLSLSDGRSLDAALVVAADGRNSAVRRMAGLATSTRDFNQHAMVLTVIHAEPHEGIALQRFQPVGAVASLPLATTKAGHRSQIVWSDRPDAVAAAKALGPKALIALINERLWGALDVTGIDGDVQSYPLISRRSEALAIPRVALVGDAARAIHPLAGQGWNLAVRDIAALADGVGESVSTGQDIGTSGLIGYERWRRADETALAALTGALASAPTRGPLSILGHARRAAFAAIDEIPSLHGLIRSEAAGETGDRPPLLL